mgnify:CR=1 FL=1
MPIDMTIDDENAERILRELERAMSQANTDLVVFQEAEYTRGQLATETPKGWTGQTKREWRTARITNGWAVTNDSRVMRWLEKGTKAHGPKTAKVLFIPLTASAAIGGWKQGMKFGRDYVLKKWVKGIKAHRIVEAERPQAQIRLRIQMERHIEKAIAKAIS